MEETCRIEKGYIRSPHLNSVVGGRMVLRPPAAAGEQDESAMAEAAMCSGVAACFVAKKTRSRRRLLRGK
jgi:hypothetical protein